MKFLVLVFSIFSIHLVHCKCAPNTFCFDAKDTNFTVSCVRDTVVSLTWNTEKLNSTVGIWNAGTSHQFFCELPITNPKNITFGKFSNFSKSGNSTSCQVVFDMSSIFMFKKNEMSFLDWNGERSTFFKFSEICNPKVELVNKSVKRLLVKAHAILMLLGWLFLIPTGFVFARFGKSCFENQKIRGLPVWFQIHRNSTFLGVSCIVLSIFCIFLSTNFTWKGTGSSAWYWTQWHTDLGTVSTVLAVAQPLNSLLRCAPSNPKRSRFNWTHRIVGILSYTFAVSAIYVAAANYRKTWSEPVMEIALTSLPTVLCGFTAAIVWFLEKNEQQKGRTNGGKSGYQEVEMNDTPPTSSSTPSDSKTPSASLQLLKTSWLSLCVGVFFGVATSLSLLVANGFKND